MKRFELNKNGITRDVILFLNYAIKFPTIRYGLRFFLEGMVANIREKQWWLFSEDKRLCPILYGCSLFVIMPRCKPVLNENELDYTLYDGLPSDNKIDNFGILNERIVKLDYGSN